ncbi:mechanosensitive ion channel family protein, partial [Methanosalsum natronophilum]
MVFDLLEQTIPYTDIMVTNLLFSIFILIVGYIGIKIILNGFLKGFKSTNLPGLVVEFLATFFKVLLYILLILVFLSSLGFDVNSVVIGLSAVIGLILGFGLQDTLTNLASGI